MCNIADNHIKVFAYLEPQRFLSLWPFFGFYVVVFSFWEEYEKQKTAARRKIMQLRIESGFVSAHFPEVASILD